MDTSLRFNVIIAVFVQKVMSTMKNSIVYYCKTPFPKTILLLNCKHVACAYIFTFGAQ